MSSSTIVTTGIDDTKPVQGNATTSSVRANFTAIIAQFAAAAVDINAILDGTYTLVPTISGGTISGTTIDNAVIGGTTAVAGTFTALTATGAFTSLGIDDNASSTLLTLTGTTRLGINQSSPDGTLHVFTASAGVVTASIYADDLVVENSSDGGISLVTPDANGGNIMWASPSSNSNAIYNCSYNAGNPRLYHKIGGAYVMTEYASGITVGPVVTTPDGTLHVMTASAGTVTASTSADDLIVENSASGGISVLTPSSTFAGMYLGSGSNSSAALLAFNAQCILQTTQATGTILLKTGSATTAISIDSAQNVSINTAAIATTATDGFLYIPSCAGAPTGTPTAKTGLTPMVYDSTNNHFYIYNGGWKSVALA